MRNKAKYFALENMDRKAVEMLRRASVDISKQKIAFVPARSALLVLDMQEFFLNEASHAFIPSAPAIVPAVKRLIEAYAGQGRPVIFTRHVNTAADAEMMAKWWRDVIYKDNPLSRITDELDTSSAVILNKTQYDAFYQTSLEEILKEKQVLQLVITGLMANLCCETTGRSAFVRGFEVFFVVDGTAAYNEDYHVATLMNLSFGFAVPVTVPVILDAMRGDHDG